MGASPALAPDLKGVLDEFRNRSGMPDVGFEVKQRAAGDVLVLHMAHPTNRFFAILEAARERHGLPTATIARRASGPRLQSPEARLLQRTLAESLTVGRQSFGEDFFARYTHTVTGAEAVVTARANHVVYGRRGAGKSSLLLYALRSCERECRKTAWLGMQALHGAGEALVLQEIVAAILDQVVGSPAVEITQLLKRVELSGADLQRLLLRTREAIVTAAPAGATIFLDDFHLLRHDLQPRALQCVYGLIRDTPSNVKLSAIESLSRTWDAVAHVGMEVGHDLQAINLDLNLTVPERALSHIAGILDAHARYCGLESIRYLCNSEEVLTRLMWVSAGVPRDAMNNFSQAMARDQSHSRSKVSVMSVNESAGSLLIAKEQQLEVDVQSAGSETRADLRRVIALVKDKCIGGRRDERRNAFLVELRPESRGYRAVRELVDLRLLHVIGEAISLGRAGHKFLPLILDYGYYTGQRRAQSVDLFNPHALKVRYRDLRKLPRVDPDEGL